MISDYIQQKIQVKRPNLSLVQIARNQQTSGQVQVDLRRQFHHF